MPEKLYCYVDESGQDTRGRLFVVGVVVAGPEREQLRAICERIESSSKKGALKWVRVTHNRQVAYVREVLLEPAMRGKLYYALYAQPDDYLAPVIMTIVRAVETSAHEVARTTILIDGLPAKLERAVGNQIRKRGIRVRKVRGVRDEGDALIRLADAVCGLVRAASDGAPGMRSLVELGVRVGALQELSP